MEISILVLEEQPAVEMLESTDPGVQKIEEDYCRYVDNSGNLNS